MSVACALQQIGPPMSLMGQNRKSSMRANVFRCTPNNGHRSIGSACGRLIEDITHLVPGRDDLLGALDRGDLDATLLDLRRFDAYALPIPIPRSSPPGTIIRLAPIAAMSALLATRLSCLPSILRSPSCRPQEPYLASHTQPTSPISPLVSLPSSATYF
jgi:hypothetical protein